MSESHLMIYPSGELRWVEIERKPYEWIEGEGLDHDRLHELIGCDCLEQVRTVLHNIVLVIDESGKIKSPPQPHYEVASKLYLGYIQGLDDIVGPALVCSLRPVPPYGEMEWSPLSAGDLAYLSLFLGVELPEHKSN